MKDLEYKVGDLDVQITDDGIYMGGPFVVEVEENVVSIYVAKALGHNDVINRFGLKKEIVGGGYSRIESGFILLLCDYSTSRGAIPNYAAEELARKLSQELKQKGAKINGIRTDTKESELNSYWGGY